MSNVRRYAKPRNLFSNPAAFLASITLPLALTAAQAADLEPGSDWLTVPTAPVSERWNGWASLGGAWSSDSESFGEFVIFGPLWQDDDSLLFGEGRGRYFEDDLLAGNAAIGIRQMTGSGFNLGAWVGLDVFQSAADNTFGQVSGGVEALSTYFDFRANGYLPFTDPQAAPDGVAEVVLTNPIDRRGEIYMINGSEVAAHGGDFEAGLRLPFWENRGHLGAYGGGYWYDADEFAEAVTGGMARAELAFSDIVGPGSRLTAVYRYTDDNLSGGNHMVGGALRIPLGRAPALSSQSQQWQRMIEPLQRNPNIVTGLSEREAVEDGYTGVRFDRVAYSDNTADLNSDTDPITGAGSNTLLIVDGSQAPIAGPIELQAAQTLAGGDSLLKVRGVDGGAVAYVDMPGSRPTIEFLPGPLSPDAIAFALTLGGHNTVNGVDIAAGLTQDTGINGVTFGGIDGTGGDSANLESIAILDTNVNVNMTGSAVGIGENEFRFGVEASSLYGVALDGAEHAWLEGTTVNASMEGMGTGDFFGIGVSESNLSGITLNSAEHVRLKNTTVNASMEGTGTGGLFGIGVLSSDLSGIALNGAEHTRLENTMVTATMTGTGTSTGGGNGTGDSYGVDNNSNLYGIALNGAQHTWLEDTTVLASMDGTGTGNELGASFGTNDSNLYGIALNGAEHAWLDNTMVTVSMAGTGTDGTIENGVTGISMSTLYAIALNAASDVSLTDTGVMASLNGIGGNGVAGGNGIADGALYGIAHGSGTGLSFLRTNVAATINGMGGDGSAGNGGDGVFQGLFAGIDLGTSVGATFTDTTVDFSITGNGGNGAGGGTGGIGNNGAVFGTIEATGASGQVFNLPLSENLVPVFADGTP